MTAHAAGAEQIAGVADAALDARSARTIEQPRVHLSQMIVKPLANGIVRIGIRRGPADAQLDFVARGVGFRAQEVNAARFQDAVDLGAVLFNLLVDALVGVHAFLVLGMIGACRNADGPPPADRQRSGSP